MSLSDVKRAIEEKTKSEVDAVLSRGREEAEKILADAKEQVSHARETHDLETKQMLASMERREHASSVFLRKTVLLEQKRKAIDSVFAQAKEQLAALSGTKRQELLDPLVAKAKKAGTQVATIRCNPADVSALKRAFPDANVTGVDNVLGGFTADDQDGLVRLDYTFDTVLAGVSEQVLGDLSLRLFGKK